MNEALLNQKIGCADNPQSGRGALEPGLIRNLVAALKQRQVCFCHWKSNIRLGDSLSGKEDLDLLVLRSDAAQFKYQQRRGLRFQIDQSKRFFDYSFEYHSERLT